MEKFFWAVICLIALKSKLGLRWPWEPIVKARESLKKNLTSIKGRIPTETYNEMAEAIDRIH